MPNTITGLIITLYEALDVVSRELVGLIPSVTMVASAERAAVGQTITSFTAPAVASSAITPGVDPPDDGDQTFGKVDLVITKAQRVPVRWNGEQSLSLDAPGGPGRANMMKDQFEQAMRALTNEIEGDLAALAAQASLAYGTPGTAPFGFSATKSGYDDVAYARKMMVDNGAPPGALQLVLDTLAGANLRSLAQLNNVAASADQSFLRQGVLLPIHGVDIRESAAVTRPASGGGSGYTSTAAGFPIGTTSIPVITGTGTILAGDVVSFTGDSNKYVVATGVGAPGTIVLAAPGLKKALPAVATAMSISTASTRNMIFSRNAIALAARVPARPKEGDLADDVTTITDSRSGLSFEVSMYRQYRQIQFEIAMAWGVKVVKPEHLGLLLG